MDRQTSNRDDIRTGRRSFLRGTLAAALLPLAAGCQYVVLGGYLLGGRPSYEPRFDAETKRSMTDKDVTVAVVCYLPKEHKWDFPGIDDEITKHVCHRLKDHQIQVIRPEHVRAWLDEHPDWDRPEEIGEAFGATYVIYLDVLDFSLYEAGRSNLYRGRSEVAVKVTAMDPRHKGEGEEIYTANLISKYPLEIPRDTHDVTYERFKLEYLARLSEEIGRNFYEHYAGDDMSDAT
ncbi:MAG: hypothetical protein WD069_14675 [Planctomycetales bacterium]